VKTADAGFRLATIVRVFVDCSGSRRGSRELAVEG
jgi:hypothetical protein